MGLELAYGKGQTPLSEEEKEGLLQRHISTKDQLDEAEQLNIEEAIQWTLQKKFNAGDILSHEFVQQLHRRMYKDVWSWAGKFRRSDKSIGVDWKQLSTALRQLVDDCHYWTENDTFGADEIAIRFKHRVVSIHCFPNGNGRHSRLMADIIVNKIFGKPVFTWGSFTLTDAGRARTSYLEALKTADKGKFGKLIAFSRS